REHGDLFGLSESDLGSLAVVRESLSAGSPSLRSGIDPALFVALDQRWQGRQVYSATYVAALSSRGQIASISGQAGPDLPRAVNRVEPKLTAIEALQEAAASIGASFTLGQHPMSKPEGPEQRQTFVAGSDFNADVPVRLIYYPVSRASVRLVWEVTAGRA